MDTNLVHFNYFLLCFMWCVCVCVCVCACECAHTHRHTHTEALLWICPLGFSFCSLHFHHLLVQMFCEVGPWFGYSKLFIRYMFTTSCLFVATSPGVLSSFLDGCWGFFWSWKSQFISLYIFEHLPPTLTAFRHSTSLKNFKNLCNDWGADHWSGNMSSLLICLNDLWNEHS